MLEELRVRDLALIQEVLLDFGPGMTVLTGETGAGKTALLGALKLLLGERADSGSVRAGAAEALVEGRFATREGEVVARRRVSADGRSRCYLDESLATVGVLGERLGPLVDLHGQHDHQALLRSATHVGYLDRWAGEAAEGARAEYRQALTGYREAVAARDRVADALAEAARNADYLAFVAAEIERIDPRLGEDDELEARLPQLKHAERLAEAASEAARLVRGDGGALDALAQARAALERVRDIDPALDAIAERLDETTALADDAGTSARQYRDAIEHDPAALESALARLSELAGIKKKYGPTLERVLSTRAEAQEALEAASAGDEAFAEAEKEVAQALARLKAGAAVLADVRAQTAPGFVEALEAEVADLAMPGARFEVSMEPLEFDCWTSDGPHRVEFLYAPAPGQPARPLARIASGGEISRVMLALKGVLGAADQVETLVFDEIDAGIGGATAQAVGARLAALAREHQVLVVTHLAQVAAFADDQLVVSRGEGAQSATTTVRRVSAEERIAEIARMLSGSDSEAGLAHARELLEAAESARKAWVG